jgi:chaperonin GroEL
LKYFTKKTLNKCNNFSGIDLVRKALRMPCLTIAQNAGVDGNEVVQRVLTESGDQGYDALKGEFVNMIERGIIDPTKVCNVMIKRHFKITHK